MFHNTELLFRLKFALWWTSIYARYLGYLYRLPVKEYYLRFSLILCFFEHCRRSSCCCSNFFWFKFLFISVYFCCFYVSPLKTYYPAATATKRCSSTTAMADNNSCSALSSWFNDLWLFFLLSMYCQVVYVISATIQANFAMWKE